jgi:hypothetical protein
MKQQELGLSNIFEDPSIRKRKGLRMVKTPDRNVWRGMRLIDDESSSRSVSPCSRKKIEEMRSNVVFAADRGGIEKERNKSGKKVFIEKEWHRNIWDRVQKTPPPSSRRINKSVVVEGEPRFSNTTSKENMLKTGWEIKYIGRKLPKPPVD